MRGSVLRGTGTRNRIDIQRRTSSGRNNILRDLPSLVVLPSQDDAMLSEDDVRGSVVRGREIVLISEEEPVADEPISFATCRLWQFGLSKMMLCFFSAPSSAVRPFRVDTLLCFALWLPQEEDNTT